MSCCEIGKVTAGQPVQSQFQRPKVKDLESKAVSPPLRGGDLLSCLAKKVGKEGAPDGATPPRPWHTFTARFASPWVFPAPRRETRPNQRGSDDVTSPCGVAVICAPRRKSPPRDAKRAVWVFISRYGAPRRQAKRAEKRGPCLSIALRRCEFGPRPLFLPVDEESFAPSGSLLCLLSWQDKKVGLW